MSTPLTIQANSQMVVPNTQVPFGAAGGTTPYSFNVLKGGAGGTIDASTGLYTAPACYGMDVVQVTDNTGLQATLQIWIDSHILLVCDVLESELGLQPGQVYLFDQKIIPPTDSRLYIAVGVISCKPFSNSNKWGGSGSGLNSIQSTNFQALLSIDIFSRSTLALNRKEEIILALNSIYSQQQQEINGFYIGKLSSGFVNVSEEDGAAILYKFNISVQIQYQITKTVAAPYYDTFTMPPSVATDS